MLFNMLGRTIPSKNCRVFSDTPREFYKLDPIDVDYATQHIMAIANGLLTKDQSLKSIKDSLVDIERIKVVMTIKIYFKVWQFLLFFDARAKQGSWFSIGRILATAAKKNYEKHAEGAYFKATLQGNTRLKDLVRFSNGVAMKLFWKIAQIFRHWVLLSNSLSRIRYQPARKNCRPSSAFELGVCLRPFEMVIACLYPNLFRKNTIHRYSVYQRWNTLILGWCCCSSRMALIWNFG